VLCREIQQNIRGIPKCYAERYNKTLRAFQSYNKTLRAFQSATQSYNKTCSSKSEVKIYYNNKTHVFRSCKYYFEMCASKINSTWTEH